MAQANSKTVLILGAGFSVGTKIPVQDNLLQEIDIWAQSTNASTSQKKTWNSFIKFFRFSLGRKIEKYKIEDIFTIFDISQINREGFRTKSLEDVQSASNDLLSSIRSFLIYSIDNSYSNKLSKFQNYSDLAVGLLKKRMSYKKKDKMSIISLNWDNYFEKMLTYRITSHQTQLSGLSLDYCTYDYSFSNNSPIPSVLKKAKGKINFKILKPHGSVNWGYCSNCTRLYISYGKKIHSTYECIKYCNKRFTKKVSLSPLMITPTFLKDLGNIHLGNIWSNSGIEISEADKLIFIGYGLRPEDYYFRQMLAKNFKTSAEIFVYDYCGDPIKAKARRLEIKSNFESFFQRTKKINVKVDGWENNVDEIISNT